MHAFINWVQYYVYLCKEPETSLLPLAIGNWNFLFAFYIWDEKKKGLPYKLYNNVEKFANQKKEDEKYYGDSRFIYVCLCPDFWTLKTLSCHFSIWKYKYKINAIITVLGMWHVTWVVIITLRIVDLKPCLHVHLTST